jgi:hypothetical protein
MPGEKYVSHTRHRSVFRCIRAMPVVDCKQLFCEELCVDPTFDVTFFILWSECRYKRRPLRRYGRMRVLCSKCRVVHEELALDDLQLVEFLLLI